MDGNRILLIEDDRRLARSIALFLQEQGFQVRHFGDGDQLGPMLQSCNYDLVLCDIMLPGTDGFEIIRQIRGIFHGPYLFLSALSDVQSQLKAFELGADDFIVKPVHPDVLLARIQACLRRRQKPRAEEPVVQIENLSVNRGNRSARVNGEVVPLSTSEFDLLWLLATHPQQALSREYLFIHTVGRGYDGLDRTIDGRVSRLRRKLESFKQLSLTICTVWGQGYMLAER